VRYLFRGAMDGPMGTSSGTYREAEAPKASGFLNCGTGRLCGW
jgi:hypothetical protein